MQYIYPYFEYKFKRLPEIILQLEKDLLIIFTRNPELGKCKTRLASKVGPEDALEIYKFLLEHTVSFTKALNAEKWVFYSNEIWEDDMWDNTIYKKRLQAGFDLGARMKNAFQAGFDSGYERVIIIGSDMHDLSQENLEMAFTALESNDFVIGPASDGGYYLLGMKTLAARLFENKPWGTETVLSETLEDLKLQKVHLLDEKNDVDHYEDIKDNKAFEPFLKHMEE